MVPQDFRFAFFHGGEARADFMGRMADGDSVFVNGHLVGTTSYFGPPRKYDIPAGVLVQGKNNVTLKLTAMNGHGEIKSRTSPM